MQNPLEQLPTLTENDLEFKCNGPDDDRVCTDINLSDYGWMHYALSTRLCTRDNGEMKVVWEYSGMKESTVYIRQLKDSVEHDYKLDVPSSIVMRGFTAFIKSWADKNDPEKNYEYAFNGMDEVLALWNETMNNCTLNAYLENDKQIPKNLTWSYDYIETDMLESRFREHEQNRLDSEEEEEEEDLGL